MGELRCELASADLAEAAGDGLRRSRDHAALQCALSQRIGSNEQLRAARGDELVHFGIAGEV